MGSKRRQQPAPARADCQYRCCSCGHRWSGPPQGISLRCPNGPDHLYIEWVNFEAWRRSPERSPEYRRIALGEAA